MKKSLVILLSISLMVLFVTSCKKAVKTEPVKEEKPIEKVEEAKPQIERPQLTEEEIFQRATIQQLNEEGHLQRIHFDFDKYNIKDNMKPILQKNADWLLGHESVQITIEGHCDERGTVEYNMALGERRAKSAKDYLVSLGVNPQRIKVVSYGKSRPLIDESNEAAWAKNRRAEFVITSK